ncbi:Ig-like domain-containing protein [Pseudomonas nicosulfuronedens]|nr:Ig-like domain-containing protein [Pseudomonas nicosulfuronedens]
MAKTIVVIDKATHAATEINQADLTLRAPSVVKLALSKEQVLSMTREGNALVIKTLDGETIVIHGFFGAAGEPNSDLVLDSGDGHYWVAEVNDEGSVFASYSEVDSVESLLVAEGGDQGALPWVLGGLALVAGGVAASNSGGGGGHHGSSGLKAPTAELQAGEAGGLVVSGTTSPGASVTVTFPDGSSTTVVADANGHYQASTSSPQTSGGVDIHVEDGKGNSSDAHVDYTDTTAPSAPSIEVTTNTDGSVTVSGNAEPGSTVTVTYPDGSTGSVVVGEDGGYSLTSPPDQPSGELTASATDDAGNTSPGTQLPYVDTTPPAAPSISVTENTDGGLTISGSAEAGSIVTVTFPDGSVGNVMADDNGQYSITTHAPQASGEVSATATDIYGNTGEPGNLAYVDSTPPDAPLLDPLIALEDGSVTVCGNAEPGCTVTVTFPDGSTGTTVADANGAFAVTSVNPQPNGEVSAAATDLDGNTGPAATDNFADSTPPGAPVLGPIITNEDGSITVGGSAEPGSTVTVTYPDGSTGSVVVGDDGSFTFTSPENQPTGDISVNATDEAGNTGASATESYTDTTAPEAPSVNVTANADGGLTVTGSAEAGSTVTVTFPDGSTATATAGSDGSYEITTHVPQTSGEVSAAATDAAGNTGGSTTFPYTDSTAPQAPVLDPIIANEDGSITVGGSAEPGSTVTVTYPDGSTGNVVVGEDGSWSITSPEDQPTGEISVNATDEAGNTGASVTENYADTTAPEAPSVNVTPNADGGLTVTGSAEAGSTVSVTFPDGSTATATAGSDGSYEITTHVPQTSGEVSAAATDAAGNTGDSTSVTYTDSTAPQAPVLDPIVTNEDGSITIGGSAEPGSTVTVTYPDGSTGNVVVGEDGSWSITSPENQPTGDINVNATDEAGNTGPSVSESFTDTTAPEAPSVDVTANADGGLTVSGSAEPGTTVTVTFPDGSSSTATAGSDGSYEITTHVPQTSGDVSAAATDAAGNTGDSSTFPYTDSTAPEAPVLDPIVTNEDGSITVGGSAEPGSTVTVTYPDGSTGDVVVGEDGSWSVTSPDNQPSGEISVNATDEAGNTGASVTESYTDTTAPEAPSVNVTANADGGLTVTGSTEPGTTVTVTFPDGSTGTATAGGDGSYSVTTNVPQTSGDVSAVATDAAGNSGDSTTQGYTDSTAPLAPVLDPIVTNDDGSITIGGSAEPGSTVTVTYPDGSTGNVVVGEDGSWSITSPENQPTGDINVNATDEAGNTGPSVSESFTDTTAPEAPSVNVTANTDGGLTVTGSAEPGTTVTVTFPDGSTGTATAGPDGSYEITTHVPQTSGEVSATATDAAGNTGDATTQGYTDSTAPEAPVLDPIVTNEDGSVTVGGSAEPGSTVTVTYPDGSTGDVVVGEDGSWSITSPENQPTGEISVNATDEAGNTGPSVSESFTDTTAPEAPSVNVTANADGGLTVTGTAEAGSTVTVTFPDGSTGTATAGTDGSYSVTTTVPQTSGEVSASATDVAGNSGDSTSVTYTDSTAPQAPVLDPIVTNEDGSITLGGSAEPGSTVTVTYPDGSTGSVVAGEDGSFTLTSPENQPTGEISVNATDEAGNTGASATESYTDTTAPDAPSVNVAANADGGLTVTGTAEAGSSVTVTFPDGSTGTATAGSDGSYSVTTQVPQTSGEVSATATDEAGNTGDSASLAYVDDTAPQAPALDPLQSNADGSITVSGSAEPGSTVNVTYPDGSTGSVVAGEDGSFTLTSPAGQPSGDVTASATDEAGNTGPSATGEFADTTAPEAPSVTVTANADGGLTVSGSAEPGSTVTVTFPDGSTGTGTAGGDGSYSITTTVPQTTGEVSATATDAAGNTGDATSQAYTDSTAPQAPVLDPIVTNEDGSITLGGSAEPGSTVTVTYPDGSTGSVVAGEDGSWSTTSPENQPSGEVSVNATDEAGNTGPSATESYADTTAPDAPSMTVTANADGGLTVSGTAEAGSSVTVTFPDGSTGTATAGSDGSYSVTTNVPQTSGEVSATATDAAGNTGDATTQSYADNTAPQAPVLDPIVTNDDGSVTVGGSAEPGSTVTVTYPDGSTGSVVAGEDGSFSITSPINQPSGDVSAKATDEAGNTGDSVTESYTDTTAPEAPSVNVTANADGGLTVSGSAEPGSTVTVTFPDGSSDTVTAGSDGSYGITTHVPQTSGEVSASATDAAGNTGDATTQAYTDSTAPQAPVLDPIVTNDDGSVTVGGSAEPGSTVTVTYPDGSTGDVVVGEDGSWSITSPENQPTGEISVNATDEAGNTGASVTESYTDTTAPEAPSVTVTANADGGLTVSGSAEPGSTVTVTFPDGSSDTVTAGSDGSYGITTHVPQTSGEVSASATDAAGNTGDATTQAYTDSTAPQAPVLDPIVTNEDGSVTVGGSAEPGSTVTITYPDGTTGSVVAGEDGSWSITSPENQPSGDLTVKATDEAGNTGASVTESYTDTTAPDAPSVNVAANADGGLTVTGTAEAGSTVTVTFPDGTTGTAIAGSDGSYSVTTTVPQTSGEISATATDAAGNTGDATAQSYTDSTAPLAPVLDPLVTNEDGSLTIGGSAEPGSTVTVTYPDGTTGSVVAGEDGSFTLTSPAGQPSGDVTAKATDEAGNTGPSATGEFADTTAPDAPSVNVTANADGGLTVTGSAEAGSTVTVTFPDGSTATTTAGGDGSYSISTQVPQTSGEVSATATDAAGNTGDATTQAYTDSTAPQAPVLDPVVTNEDGSITVGGSAEPGSTVTITYPDGTTGSVVAGEDGSWSVTSPDNQPSGEISVNATDEAGNTGASVTESYTDTTAPDAPSVNVTANADGGLTVTGTAEAGSSVTVTFPDGSTDTATAGSDGSYSITTHVPQTSGDVTASASDAAGNVGDSTTVGYTDTGAPQSPSVNVSANADGGLTVSGSAEAGSTVTVTFPDGSTASVTAGSDGSYEVTTHVPQTSGDVSASATDAAGNTGAPTVESYSDTQGPQAPSVNVTANADGGLTVSGSAEAGSSVTVTFPDGSTDTVTAGSDGSYSVTTSTPQTTGEVSASATDAAGNTGAAATVDYTDSGAPLAPSVNVGVNADGGLTVSGSAEAGSSVTVTFPDGSTGTATAGTDGSYSVTTHVPQTSGDVSASATDAAGNASAPTVESYTDSTAPLAPELEPLVTNGDGSVTLTGSAEAGSTVTVTFPDGTTGSVVTGSDGTFSITSPAGQPTGDVTAKATDEAGNTGPSATGEFADTTAPDAPSVNVSANADGGLTVSGSAEAGSTVTVTFPDGSSTTTTAGSDGAYSVTTTVPQTTGEVSATATDSAGNTGDAATVGYTDTGAPQSPSVNVSANADGGLTVTGMAEAGSTVTVTFPDGSTGTAIAGSDGSYSVTTHVPQTSGEVSATATDAAGNSGAAATVDYTDTGAPLAPSVNVTANADGGLTVSGTAEAGSSVTVTFPDGSTGTATAGSDGSYSVTTTVPQTSGEVSATATDAAGNTGGAGTADYTDSAAPLAPSVNVTANADGGLTVSGMAEAGSSVTVTFPDGSTGTATAGSDGSYSVTTTVPQTSGNVSASATDAAGNAGASTVESYTDNTAPLAPVLDPLVNNADGSVTVSGSAEAGSSVTVTYPDGTTGSVTAGSDGRFSVTSPVGQPSGEVSASASDAAGNNGPSSAATFTDTTAPTAPSANVAANADGGLTVSGTAEAGSTVTVTFPDGTSGTAVAGTDGSYSVTTHVPQTSGDVSALATDAAGNNGPATTAAYTDTSLPQAPVLDPLVNNADGSVTVSGSAEAGSSVTVTYPDGTSGSVTAGTDGRFSVTSPVGQPSGEVSASATDLAGNVGPAATADFTDTTAPGAPSVNITVNADGGLTVSGSAEAGSTVTVTFPSGATGTAIAGSDGSYSVTTHVPQSTGEVSAAATDAAGNTGTSASADYADSTAPLAPSVLVNANADGTLVVSGNAEAGSSVTVTFPDGTQQTVTASAAGTYSVTSAGAQGSGEVSAVATDAAHNSSASGSAHYALATVSGISEDNGLNSGDFITNDNTLVVSATVDGQLNAGDKVQISIDGGQTWHDAVDQGNGTYVFDNSGTTLGDGDYVFMARVVGSEGNVSLAGSQAVQIDTQGPSASLTISFDGISDDNGYLGNDFVTNDNTLLFHGHLSQNLAADEGVEISLDGGQTWQRVEVNGTDWSFDNTGKVLGDAVYDVQVRVVDDAGNVGNSASHNVQIDTDGPSADKTITLDAISDDNGAQGNDFITNDNTLVFSGKLGVALGAGEGVEISLDGGQTWQRAEVNGTDWRFDNTGKVIADGSYTVVVRVVDDAGNIGQSAQHDLSIDTQAPTFTSFVLDLDTASDNGSSTTDNKTSVMTPSFTGTVAGLSAADAAAAAAGKITVMLFDDKNGDGVYGEGDVLYAQDLALTMNGTGGTFNVTLPSMFDGSYNMKAVLVDEAGNRSQVGLLDNNADARLVIDVAGTPSVASSTQAADGLGLSMSSIGDFNGDGYEDFVVSAPHDIYGSTAAYQSDIYVLYGSANGLPSLKNIDNLTPDQGFRIKQSGVTGTGGDSGIQGQLVTNLGDINGDGYDDFAITGTLNDRAYIIFGREGNTLSTLDLQSLENGATANGFVIKNNNTGGWPANSISGGDINGDGYADLIIGSPDGNGGNGMYVVLYGHAGDAGSSAWSNLLLRNYASDADPGGLYYATGATSSTLGSRVENQTNVRTTYAPDADSDLGSVIKIIGDVNGDGYADYIVTAPRTNGLTGSTVTNSGTAYLIWGSANGLGNSYNLANLTPDQGVRLVGSETGEWLGGATVDQGGGELNAGQWYAEFSSIQNIGDINGDGIEDFAIGSPGWGDSAADTSAPGRVYVIYGKEAGVAWADIKLGNLNGSDGFIISSSSNGTAISGSTTTANGQLGYAVSSGGDVNGDGIDDFLIGMPGYDNGVTNRGAVYLVYGRADGSFDANTDLDALVAAGLAVKYTGVNANDYAGTGLAMGDWNGDGIADYGYGVWQSDTGATNAGGYNIYSGSIALLTHSYTVGDDEIWAGTTSPGASVINNGVDIISGGQGNDIIHGIGTDTTGTTDTSVQHDVAMGGAGNDTIGLVGTTFTRVDGGLGIDTLKFEASGLQLDLTSYGTRVKGFEIFDLGSSQEGSGNNTLSLRLADVLKQVDTTSAEVPNLMIKGDGSSTVDLAETVGSGGWEVSGSKNVNGVDYDIWHNASMGSNTNADLLIQHGINVV